MNGLRAPTRLAILALAVIALALPVSAAADLAAIRQAGVLRVGTTGDYAPFSVVKGESYSGFDVDLVSRLARDLGVRVEYVRFRWPNLEAALSDGDFDVAASGVTVRPERAFAGRYTRPYALTGAVALIRREDAVRFSDRAALDRLGVRIAVNRGGHLERVARRLFPRAAIEPVGDNTSLPERVLAGTAAAALTDSAEAHAWQRPELRTVGPFSRDRKALLVRRDAPELAAWLDTWLRQRERDGWLGRLRQQWFGDTMFFAAGADREAVLADVELRCRLMPAVAATKLAHHVPIEDREQEARVIERARASARSAGLHPDEIERLMRSLINAAKAIQQASGTDPHAVTPPLEQLRVTLADIDDHLIRQLRQAARRVKAAEWAPAVRDGIEADGLTEALKADLARALEQAHTLAAGAPQPARSPAAVDKPPRTKKARAKAGS